MEAVRTFLSFISTIFLTNEFYSPYKPNPNYKGKWYAPLIDNPAYKGEWAPRKIANPDYFEDLSPVKSLVNIGGIGIELWTMTPNILFDNIYVGHSAEDAKALASETFDIKHPLEEAQNKAKKVDEDEDEEITFKDDPVGFIRQQIFTFIDDVKENPVEAFKSNPQTGGAILVTAFTFVGMLLTLAGVIGSAQKPVTKVSYSLYMIEHLLIFTLISHPRKLKLLPLIRKLLLPLSRPPVESQKTALSRSAAESERVNFGIKFRIFSL